MDKEKLLAKIEELKKQEKQLVEVANRQLAQLEGAIAVLQELVKEIDENVIEGEVKEG